NPGQATGAKQPCQAHRITPVGLDPFAGLLRDRGGRDDGAVVTQTSNLAVQPVPRRTRFVTEMQLLVAARQLSDHPLDRQRRTVDLAEIPDLTLATDIGDRYRRLLLRRVKCGECFAILLPGTPSLPSAPVVPPRH